MLPSLCSLQSLKHTTTLFFLDLFLLPGAITLLYSEAIKCISDEGTTNVGGVFEYVGCDVQMLCRVTMHNYSSEILSNDVMCVCDL